MSTYFIKIGDEIDMPVTADPNLPLHIGYSPYNAKMDINTYTTHLCHGRETGKKCSNKRQVETYKKHAEGETSNTA
jgi:hypothetical protein